jgi:hypothetical protein
VSQDQILYPQKTIETAERKRDLYDGATAAAWAGQGHLRGNSTPQLLELEALTASELEKSALELRTLALAASAGYKLQLPQLPAVRFAPQG